MMEALQWFAIWTIVFPKDELPLRPYYSGEAEAAVCEIRKFWSAQGPVIVSRFLEANDPRPAPSRGEDQSTEALQRAVLDRMADTLVASFKRDDGGRLRGPERTGQVLASLGRCFSKNH
ncbi:hypothetical protein SLS62_004878 [Diatrype stigma]|uniref:Uncharacterized protein n=1 Tax=Diatrype stigma TaxID=117547 RepID=A0AAN9USH8_9PEZI